MNEVHKTKEVKKALAVHINLVKLLSSLIARFYCIYKKLVISRNERFTIVLFSYPLLRRFIIFSLKLLNKVEISIVFV